METVSLGLPELDKMLLNGVPKGSLVLLLGSPHTGMELFAKQIAHFSGGDNVVYFATNERTEDIIDTMKNFKWRTDIKIVNIGTQHYQRVLMRDIEASKLRHEGFSQETVEALIGQRGGKEQFNFLTELIYEISKLKPPYRAIIESYDFFLRYYSTDSAVAAIRTIKSHTQHSGGLAVLTMLKDVHDAKVQGIIEGVADCVIELEAKRGAEGIEHNLIIKKLRNYPSKSRIVRYESTESGIVIRQ
ncbi:MAG: RAD55 family ATPase [Thermoplasmata archaeon]